MSSPALQRARWSGRHTPATGWTPRECGLPTPFSIIGFWLLCSLYEERHPLDIWHIRQPIGFMYGSLSRHDPGPLERYSRRLTKVEVMKHLIANYSFLTEGGLLAGQQLLEEAMNDVLGVSS